MRHPGFRAAFVIVISVFLLTSCATRRLQMKSSALEFLYPKGTEAVPARDVTMKLPLRVGIAFAPAGASRREAFPEADKQALLERVAQSFRDRDFVGSLEVIPTTYLNPQGGFENLDQIGAALGIDVVALVSYEQMQFSDTTRASWTYWTVIGAWLVKGEKNETRTIMDAVVYDIPSRALLFRAAGQSSIGGRSTPVDVEKTLRGLSERGFKMAADDLVASLNEALAAFQEQAASGTVRGEGTPSVTMVDASGNIVTPGSGLAGSFGIGEMLAAGLLAALAIGSGFRRRRP
jgi:rhombotail lipoprotein